MPKARVTVQQLSNETEVDPETVRFFLRDAGVDFDPRSGLIPRKKIGEARRALGLPPAKELRSVKYLAERASMPEDRARAVLAAENLLATETFVARNRLRRAEQVLGLRNRPDDEMAHAAPPKDSGPSAEGDGSGGESDLPLVEWQIVGPPAEVSHLTADQIEEIHDALVRDFARSIDPVEPAGVRDRSLLESAAFRAHTSIGDAVKYPTVAMAGAATFHALVHDHPFFNGNKRTALVSLIAFLDGHGQVLTVNQDTLYDFVLTVARHGILAGFRVADGLAPVDAEVVAIARWIQKNMRPIRKEEFPLKFHEVRTILASLGCDVAVNKGKATVTRTIPRRGFLGRQRQEELKHSFWYAGEGRELDRFAVKKIRAELLLDEEHGYDSAVFYQKQTKIDDFVVRYRRTLQRLARV